MIMKFAYADPPYIGQAKKHYNSEEVNHFDLIEKLNADYDAWALSCSSPSLQEILSYCPKDVRIMAWVKPFAIFKPNVNPGYTWEPVVAKGFRKRDRYEPTVRDFISCNITLKKGMVGVKPEIFCFWLFDVIGLQKDDEFHDIFPGTGAVTNAWNKWKITQSNNLYNYASVKSKKLHTIGI